MAEQSQNEKLIEKNGFYQKIVNLMPEFLRDRFSSAVVLIPVAFILLLSPAFIFNICLIAISILLAYEWITITNTKTDDNYWKFLGLVYIILPMMSLMYIKSQESGTGIIIWLILVEWAFDTLGLIVGTTLKGPKLAPSISPKKTWSGFIGGVLGGMFIGVFAPLFFKETASFFIILSGFLAVLVQIGDLIESKFKRLFGVKDSGNLIPGHGGIMDRLDGLTLEAPFVAIIVLFSSNIF